MCVECRHLNMSVAELMEGSGQTLTFAAGGEKVGTTDCNILQSIGYNRICQKGGNEFYFGEEEVAAWRPSVSRPETWSAWVCFSQAPQPTFRSDLGNLTIDA